MRKNRKAIRYTQHALRRSLLLLVLLSFFGGGFPSAANAAVPVWVVQFDANTAFETSLETFLFDLFNTLQRRQEDFTAAYELQKIEKAREDVNKLFQETNEELQNFGQTLTENPTDITGKGDVRDPRVGTGDRGQQQCINQNAGAQIDATPRQGCPPTISPIKDSRIVHDPYQYLFGDASTKAQIYLYCFFDYVIWDQQGFLPDHYTFLKDDPKQKSYHVVNGIEDWYTKRKATYDPTPPSADKIDDKEGVPLADMTDSVNRLKLLRNQMVVATHRGNYYQLNYPLHEIYGYTGNGNRKDPRQYQYFTDTEPRCRQAMYVLGADSPVTVEQNVQMWKELTAKNGVGTSPKAESQFRTSLWFLPTLLRNIANRAAGNGYSWEDWQRTKEDNNTLSGLTQTAVERAQAIIQETETERQATYIAGQGVRPENFYVTLNGANPTSPTQFQLNTEYVISPAVILLQKMQAATQATFDLAGQGFLYLSPNETPDNILASYNVASTKGNEDERKICNQAGSCALLDAWLKPAANFRTTSVITANGPQLVGVTGAGAVPGSGLPAPWEDAGSYLNISNEKSTINTEHRYTIARFLADTRPGGKNNGKDEFDTSGVPTQQDNIRLKLLGADYPLNDWYNRVIEMYEAGIGKENAGLRTNRQHDFTIYDWQCYLATWFIPQTVYESTGKTMFVQRDVNTEQSILSLNAYCGQP